MKKIVTILMLLVAGFVLVTVAVLGCARAGGVKLAWNPNPPAEQVEEYRVWRGTECLATVSGTSATVTVPDGPCVLTVTARNTAGESSHSAALELIAVTVEESTDLKTWVPIRTIHRERKAEAFYRLRMEVAE